MKIKKIMRAFVAVLLIACSLFAVVGCDSEPEAVNLDKLPNQYETKNYYFRQGYSNEWEISLQPQDGKLVPDYENQGLALQIVPKAEESGVYYNVFCNWNKDIGMTNSAEVIAEKVMNENSNLNFNKINFVEERDEYQVTSETPAKKIYNKKTWNQVEFTYIDKDGEQCKGVWNLLTDGTNYYVVSYEAKEAKFSTYFAAFEEMIDDFKKVGFEKEK